MNKSLSMLSLALLLGAASAAEAQDADQLVLSGGLVFAQGNALDMTHKTSGGYGAEVGYQFSPKDFGADVLVYGGWQKLPAANPTTDRPTFALMGPHVGIDLVFKPWDRLPVTIFTGPSAHVWQVEQQGVSNGNKGDQGPKLGWRVGVGYAFAAQWNLSLSFTQTEWRSSPDSGINPSRPAFVSLMASYHF